MISHALTQSTDLLYQRNGQVFTLKTSILSIQPLSNVLPEIQRLFKPTPGNQPYILTTTSTIFHPQGGGQPSDTGDIVSAQLNTLFRVQQVRKVGPAVLHMGVFDLIEKDFEKDSRVEQRVDVSKRVLHSRVHTGGHVVGLAVNQLIASGSLPSNLVDGKASHYPGASFVEFTGLIPVEAKAMIQAKIDELVAQDLNVKIHFWSKAKAQSNCTRMMNLPEGGTDVVRIVEIGDVGSYPCGGTHVLKLRECGRVLVRGIKRQKGVSKVSYEIQDT